jgi:hypothetical protein
LLLLSFLVFSQLMTLALPRVDECPAGDRHKLPIIACGLERQLEYAVGGVLTNLTVGLDGGKTTQACATSADDKFSDAAGIRLPLCVLWRKTLV